MKTRRDLNQARASMFGCIQAHLSLWTWIDKETDAIKKLSWKYYLVENLQKNDQNPRNRRKKLRALDTHAGRQAATGKPNCICLWGYIIKFRILFLFFWFWPCIRGLWNSGKKLFGKHTSSITCSFFFIALAIRCFAHLIHTTRHTHTLTSGNAKTLNLSVSYFISVETAPMLPLTAMYTRFSLSFSLSPNSHR